MHEHLVSFSCILGSSRKRAAFVEIAGTDTRYELQAVACRLSFMSKNWTKGEGGGGAFAELVAGQVFHTE